LPVLAIAASATAQVVPRDGQVFTASAVLVPGVYHLPNGVAIGASGVTLDLNGATLVGSGGNGTPTYGVSAIGFSNVIVQNGNVRGYYYGVRVEGGSGVQVLHNDLSANWRDPASLGSSPPFLDINVGPNLGDRTNLGGGLFGRNLTNARIAGNTLRNQENGIDLYAVAASTIEDNDASDNTGWGIHLHASTGNTVRGNTADRCIRTNLNDSAGVLLVFGSNGNRILDNSFRFGGDGFFIGNENGCPSNDNLVQGNDGSYAGANAFEATFSSGNQFIDNVADGSNYGFWLGYSHDGNVIRGNRIRANNVAGIEIEHGQHNLIEDNEIVGNGGAGIVLRTDGLPHFPINSPCLFLPDPAASSFYVIRRNRVHSNYGLAMVLTATTDCLIADNVFGGPFAGTVSSAGARNTWSVTPAAGRNVVGGPTLGGNWWIDYAGADLDGDGLGDTQLPYTHGGRIALPGDPHPLLGNPDLGGGNRGTTMCDYSWTDLGRNTRTSGAFFDTANGTHFATDGRELLLLEGTNSPRLSGFDLTTGRYLARAPAPEGVQDGGDFQFAGALYLATVGLGFDANTGAGNGPRLYAYDAAADAWSARAPTTIGGHLVANEALAFDAASGRVYATIVAVKAAAAGGDPTLLTKLAVFDPNVGSWTGATSAAPDRWSPGSEAECIAGQVFVWRGGFSGNAVNGSDSYLDVYDIATDSWARTPSLRDAAVVPGFRTGGSDVWGVSLAADPARGRLFVQGSETNRHLYVFDLATWTWALAADAPYDGGWGGGIEHVAAADVLFQVDGRNAAGTPQGTAWLTRTGCYATFGPGCAGSRGVPGNVATSLARLGQTMAVDLTNLPRDAGLFVLGVSNTVSALGPLPLDLGRLGAPGCALRVSTESSTSVAGTVGSGVATFRLPIPNVALYLGTRFYTQGVSLDPPANPLGATVSDAAMVIVGR